LADFGAKPPPSTTEAERVGRDTETELSDGVARRCHGRFQLRLDDLAGATGTLIWSRTEAII